MDAYILWFSTLVITVEGFNKDEPLSSPTVRGRVSFLAQRVGAGLYNAIGSKPKSHRCVDCAPEQIQEVVEAACRLKSFSLVGTKWRDINGCLPLDV